MKTGMAARFGWAESGPLEADFIAQAVAHKAIRRQCGRQENRYETGMKTGMAALPIRTILEPAERAEAKSVRNRYEIWPSAPSEEVRTFPSHARLEGAQG